MPEQIWTDISVPRSVGEWLSAMSERAGMPAHRIVRVLLDGYVQRLPASSRRKLDDILRRWSQRNIQ